MAVTRRLLSDQHQFLRTVSDQMLRFADDFNQRAAFLPPSQLRDNAEGAVAITAFGYLDVGHRTGGRIPGRIRRLRRHPIGIGQDDVGAWRRSPLHRGQNLIVSPGTEKEVHLWQGFSGCLAIALRKAARDDQTATTTALLVSGGRQDGVHGLVGRILHETAGVDDDGLRPGRVVHDVMAGPGQPTGHDFAVDLIAGTAQIDQMQLHAFSCDPAARPQPYSV